MSRKSSEIARENGAKAAGTKTPEGIQKSAMNAVRHGLTGKTLVLCNESQAQFDALTDRYIQKFQPQDEVDMELIEDLVAARWRLQRVRLMQAAALDLEMDRQADEVEASFVNIDEPTRVTLAFTKLANTEKSLELFHRYETAYTRQYNRTLKLLESKLETKLRNDPKSPPIAAPTESDFQPAAQLSPVTPIDDSPQHSKNCETTPTPDAPAMNPIEFPPPVRPSADQKHAASDDVAHRKPSSI
jgi:hypothetical protein